MTTLDSTISGMLHPASWPDALEILAECPDAVPICGGTDLMVDINFGRTRPTALLDLSRLAELAEWHHADDGTIRIGAGLPYTRIVTELAEPCPALAIAARTIGSPQIRNRGTIGGNLATASPAGDSHPPLLATGSTVEVESVRGSRDIAIDDFFVGPKRSSLESDELIRAIRVPVTAGPQQFAKIGPRNAMVIATASFAVAIDLENTRVGTGIGSAGPTPLRAPEAEAIAESVLVDSLSRDALTPDALVEFGLAVARAAAPIDDVRGTAEYRRHALATLGRRCLSWCWEELSR